MAAAGVIAITTGFMMMAVASPAQAVDKFKVPICHATGSTSNPYENGVGEIPKWQITDPDGHGTDVANHPNDIIPAFIAGSKGNQTWTAFAGRNLDKLDWIENGCEDPGDPDPVDKKASPVVTPHDVCGTEDDYYTVSGAGFSYSATGEPEDGSVVLNFTAKNGYFLEEADETETVLFTNTPCPTNPIKVMPVAPMIAAADCGVAGTLTPTQQPPGVLVHQNPAGTGPGTYTFTYTLVQGYEWTDGGVAPKRSMVTVDDALEDQSTDEDGDCYVPPPTSPPPVVDVCPNIDGNQAEVPDGYTKNPAGNCVPPKGPKDVCPNIDEVQTEIPDGMTKNGAGDCVEPEIAGTETASPSPTKKPDKKPSIKATDAVPTAVDAGLPGGPTFTSLSSSPTDLLAKSLVGGGLALLMAAGLMMIGRQTRGVHQV